MDSTATIILAHEHGEPLDGIIISEVMFDIKNNISGENARHMEFIKTKAIPLFKSWGYEVIRVQSDKDYLDLFYHIIDDPRSHPSHKGKSFGFPLTGYCSVKRDLKVKPVNAYIRSLDEPVVQYLGICSDEPVRLDSMKKQSNTISLLEKYNYTHEMARMKCMEYGLLSPLYELTNRSGCWFCPWAKLEEHREFKECNPNVWRRFMALETEENIANCKWNVYGQTLSERDKII